MQWLILFTTFFVLIALDLGVIHRRVQEISLYEALAMSGFWITMGLGFAVLIYFMYAQHWFFVSELSGTQAVTQYLTAFSLEKMLSLDNLFVMALIFHQLQIPVPQQHRVLYWGIFSAIVFRGIFIFTGTYLINSFSWMVYVFGAFLLLSALKILASQASAKPLEENLILKTMRKLLPIHNVIEGNHFLRRVDGRLMFTPLFIALVMIETADIMFATDSVPAVIAVSRDPYIIYSSNIFALLGLRALYFVLASALQQFHYLKLSMVMILCFIGVKMLLAHVFPISALVSLMVIFTIMSLGILVSLLDKRRGYILETSPVVTELGKVYATTYAGIKRIVILVIGSSVVIIGVIMIFTPGPAIIVIPAGLAILATEFVWAQRLLAYFKHKLAHYKQETRNLLHRKKP